MKAVKLHQFIDRAMPAMQCDHECGECCGIVNASEAEYQSILDYADANGIEPVKQGSTCPWYQDGQCAVYSKRPVMCRVYGHFAEKENVVNMTCARGYSAHVSERMERKIMNLYRQHTGGIDRMRFLHEAVVDDPAELFALITGESEARP